MPKPTDEQLRELAAAIILDHARDVEYLSISEALEDPAEEQEWTVDEHEAATKAVDELIRQADITVSWPEADSPYESRGVAASHPALSVAIDGYGAVNDAELEQLATEDAP